ncbi:polyprenyl synthetase family protein [Clostridium neuense]|uniref:Polyprenyl synthetase family protein n=1 Tax=Clostridium neuense TaxID=1728934 RepID=A0ABW8TGE7_9CLOT
MNNQVLKSEVEGYLERCFKNEGTYDKKLYEAMDYSLNVGGKRVRPLLFLNTYCVYKENYKEVIDIAAAIEMIHTYSLIHDDLPCMDNDDLRRGKPTNHKVFGEAMALLAGDGLLSEAMSTMFKYCCKQGLNAVKACSLVAKACGAYGMVGGQVVDMISTGKEISGDQLKYMHRKKTGALIKAAILSGAVLGEAPKDEYELFEEFGEKVGLAFQIKDDILDIVGDSKIMGKKAKSDIENNKTTYVTTYGLDECKKMCADITEDCVNILSKINGNTEGLKEITEFLLERKK